MAFDTMLVIDKYDSRAVAYKTRASQRVGAQEIKKQNASRAQAFADVHAAWNRDSSNIMPLEEGEDGAVMAADSVAIQQMEARLKAITIPSLDFSDANIEDVVLFLADATRKLDNAGGDVDLLLVGMDHAEGSGEGITLSIADMSLYEALQFIVEMASLKFEVKSNAVAIMPANYVPVSQMILKSYDISPEVGADLESAGGSDGGADDLFGDSSSGGGGTGPVDVAGFFSIVDFPKGASATYQPRFHKLFVRNTPRNVRAVGAVLADLDEQAMKLRSQQVEIETKFVEFNEGALEELGFDWSMFGSGTVGSMELDPRGVASGIPANTATIDPNTGQIIGVDQNDRPGQNIFGGSQRDNTGAFGAVATGVLSSMGGTPAAMLFSNGDIDLQITALEQEGSADVLSAPKVTTKSGSEAVIRVAETHRYPQDYDVETGQRTAPVVKPQDWEDFDLGVSLKVTPVVDTDSDTIDLDLQPEIMRFRGFDDYVVGFNAYDAGGNDNSAAGGTGESLLARMPAFERRSVQTQVTVADGSTVVMGGMIDERTETFRDQIPFLGDVPYLGRLFRTEGSRTAKKNLTIFVTATMVDAHGTTRRERELARQ
jgi:general secretion pathway protein D